MMEIAQTADAGIKRTIQKKQKGVPGTVIELRFLGVEAAQFLD